MRLTRVHVEGPLTGETRQTLRGTAANHISRVLRLRVGDSLTVFDGNGGEYDARIDEFSKETVQVTVAEHRLIERESPMPITLAQGISRGERMDLVIQKATELGVARIVPLITERCVVKLDAKQAEAKLRHWRAITIAACEQCGRNRLPEVEPVAKFHDYLRTAASTPPVTEHRLLLSPIGEARIRDLSATSTAVSVLIGPEGGLTEIEHESALKSGFMGVRLGPRVLRTETAALAALTAIQQHLGDL
jgi:16S rRNA (uracil1498-N3)-methyltransferase